MIAVIEKFNAEDDSVDLVVEENQNFWFSIPKNALPNNKGISIGSRLKFNIVELPKNKQEYEEEEFSGGYIKNPPRRHFDD